MVTNVNEGSLIPRRRTRGLALRGLGPVGLGLAAGGLARRLRMSRGSALKLGAAVGLTAGASLAGLWIGRRIPRPTRDEI